MEIITGVLVPFAVFFVMWVVGLELTIEDFRRVARYPKATLVGTFTQIVLLPALAASLVLLLRPGPAVVAGIVLIAAAPGGAVSNLFTLLARGNTALSVTLTALTNLLAVVTFPMVVAGSFALLLGETADAKIPVGQMMLQLVLLMMIPITLGMLVRARAPRVLDRYRRVLHRMSFAFVVLVTAAIAIDQRAEFAARVLEIAMLGAMFTIAVMLAAGLLAWMIGCPVADRIAYVMEFSARNVAVAIVVASTTLGRLDYVVFIAAYFVIQMVITVPVILLFRGRVAG